MVKNFLIAAFIMMQSVAFSYGATKLDPVSWTKVGSIPSVIQVGNQHTITYRLTNDLLPPILLRTTIVQKGSGFSVIDECNGKSLATNASCNVVISFHPLVVENASIHFQYFYGKTEIKKVPIINTTVSNSLSTNVVRVSNVTLASQTVLNPTTVYDFTATVSNSGDAAVSGYGSIDVSNTSHANVAIDTVKSTCSTNNASPTQLDASKTCIIAGTFTPITLNAIPTVTATYHHSGNKSSATSQSFIAQGDGSCPIQASVALGFPIFKGNVSSTPRFSDDVLKFTFTNHCDSASATLGKVTIDSTISNALSNNVITTLGSDDCSNKSIAPNASCDVLVSVMPQVTGTLKVTAKVNANGSNISTNAQTKVIDNVYNHSVTFINQCSFSVWYGVSNPGGTKVDPTSPDKPNDYRLLEPGAGMNAKTVVFPQYNGFFYGRTNCSIDGSSSLVCGQPNCPTNTGTGKCMAADPQNPFTRLEMDLETTKNSDGIYNVSVINGFNLAVEFKGLAAFNNTSVSINPNAPFTCAALGAPIQAKRTDGQLGSCSWKLTPPTGMSNGNSVDASDFNLVTDLDGGSDCKTTPCTSNTCGITYKDFAMNDFNLKRACGKVIGYWTVDDFCGIPPGQYESPLDQNTLFQCATLLDGLSGKTYPASATVANLYSCTPIGSDLTSCYDKTPASTCCGCKNWNQQGSYLTWQSTNCETNSDWSTTTPLSFSPLNSVEWLKTACPTSYVYPWDDKSSSANCNDTSSNPSGSGLMDYQVVFCPGGETGLPG
jgi:Thaumatin family